VSGITSWPQKI